MQRFDTVEFQATRTEDGFIRDCPIIGRSGLLRYKNADGTDRIEYRPPEEAFKADSLGSLVGKPITIGHKAMVNAFNAKMVAPVGAVLSPGRQDGDAIRADIVIYNLDTSARELSCGYRLDLDETPGTTPEGEPYDAIQRNIIYNHVAIVPKGRAGIARLNLDGDQEFDEKEKEEIRMADMTKVRLDSGIEYDCAPEIKVELEKLKADNAKLRADAEAFQEEARKAADAAQGKLDSLQAELDKARADAEETEKKHKEALDSAVRARVDLLGIAKAKKVENADSMTDEEIKVAVIKAVRGDSLDLTGKSADYIAAAFDMCKADEATRKDAMENQRKKTMSHEDTDEQHEDATDVEAAYQRLRDAEASMYLGKDVK